MDSTQSSKPAWLVTFAYYSEQADIYVVAAADEQEARERVADLASAGIGSDGGWVRKAVLDRAQVARVHDGLHVTQEAEH